EGHDEGAAGYGKDRLIGETIGEIAPDAKKEDIHDLTDDGEGEYVAHAEAEATEHVYGEEGCGKVDGQVPGPEEGDEISEIGVSKGGGEGCIHPRQGVVGHFGLGDSAEKEGPDHAGDAADDKVDRVDPQYVAGLFLVGI